MATTRAARRPTAAAAPGPSAALDHVIDNGTYGKVLTRWGLSGEAVRTSEINPPGLPKTGVDRHHRTLLPPAR
ncbi:hypothetical protein ACFV16_18400 [Streptomyces massasporeus]|uniref:hypothetical protein n=1 Tax=Streptomyces massasporeus TaxID=67324 RepID=UPI0036A8F67F